LVIIFPQAEPNRTHWSSFFASVLQQHIENRLENNPEIEFAQPLGYMVISLLVDCSYDTVMMKGTTIVVGAIGTR